MLRFSILSRAALRSTVSRPATFKHISPLFERASIVPTRPSIRFYSPQSLDVDAKIVTFEEVTQNVKNGSFTLVDVREPEEFSKGHIPGALNIPFRSSPGALGLEEAEFKDTFGFDKPSKDDSLLFYCQGGVRSSGAEQLAATYGYQNRANYKGSFGDWVENNGSVEVPSESSESSDSN